MAREGAKGKDDSLSHGGGRLLLVAMTEAYRPYCWSLTSAISGGRPAPGVNCEHAWIRHRQCRYVLSVVVKYLK